MSKSRSPRGEIKRENFSDELEGARVKYVEEVKKINSISSGASGADLNGLSEIKYEQPFRDNIDSIDDLIQQPAIIKHFSLRNEPQYADSALSPLEKQLASKQLAWSKYEDLISTKAKEACDALLRLGPSKYTLNQLKMAYSLFDKAYPKDSDTCKRNKSDVFFKSLEGSPSSKEIKRYIALFKNLVDLLKLSPHFGFYCANEDGADSVISAPEHMVVKQAIADDMLSGYQKFIFNKTNIAQVNLPEVAIFVEKLGKVIPGNDNSLLPEFLPFLLATREAFKLGYEVKPQSYVVNEMALKAAIFEINDPVLRKILSANIFSLIDKSQSKSVSFSQEEYLRAKQVIKSFGSYIRFSLVRRIGRKLNETLSYLRKYPGKVLLGILIGGVVAASFVLSLGAAGFVATAIGGGLYASGGAAALGSALGGGALLGFGAIVSGFYDRHKNVINVGLAVFGVAIALLVPPVALGIGAAEIFTMIGGGSAIIGVGVLSLPLLPAVLISIKEMLIGSFEILKSLYNTNPKPQIKERPQIGHALKVGPQSRFSTSTSAIVGSVGSPTSAQQTDINLPCEPISLNPGSRSETPIAEIKSHPGDDSKKSSSKLLKKK